MRYIAAHPLQIGGTPGMAIAHASQSLLACTFAMCNRGMNVAILFLDVQQAFYRLLRQHMMQYPDERGFELLFRSLGLHDTFEEFCALIQQGPAFEHADVSSHLKGMIAEFFRTTRFIVPGSAKVTYTRRGSRPGDSLADVCYTFALAKLLHPILAKADAHGHPILLERTKRAFRLPGKCAPWHGMSSPFCCAANCW